jgi:hypothetical protein
LHLDGNKIPSGHVENDRPVTKVVFDDGKYLKAIAALKGTNATIDDGRFLAAAPKMAAIIRQLLCDQQLLIQQRDGLKKALDSFTGYLHAHNMIPKH